MTTNANVRQALASKWWIFMLDGCLLILMGLLLVSTQLNGAVAFISWSATCWSSVRSSASSPPGRRPAQEPTPRCDGSYPVIAAGIGLVLIIDPGQSIEVIVTLLGFRDAADRCDAARSRSRASHAMAHAWHPDHHGTARASWRAS